MSTAKAWSHGYPVNESYPPSWHSFQSPAHLRAVCAVMGVAWEVGPDTPLNIAEIGCGTGFTAMMLAAGGPDWQVVGLDYNPAHIAEARSMATQAGLDNLRFVEADLAEMSDAELDQLPEFDLVTVHGLWSWVADPVREGVLRLLKRRLKPGALVLMSYNAMPGAGGSLGLARLAHQTMLAAGDSQEGARQMSRLVERMIAAEPAYLPASGWRRMFSGEIKNARPGYLLHEFSTEYWRPCFHADVAAALSAARCNYVGSATIDENFPQLSLTPQQRELWEEAPDAAMRELIFDVCVPRQFRRDVYVRGLRHVARDPAVDALGFVSIRHATGERILRTQAGEAKLPQALLDGVRAELAKGPRTIAQLRALPTSGTVTGAELVALLIGAEIAQPLWREPGAGKDWDQAIARARHFNAVAAERMAQFGIGSASLGLATPVLGGGLQAPPLELALARIVEQDQRAGINEQDPMALLRRILPPGAAPEESVIDEVRTMVTELLRERRATWAALGVV